MLKEIDVWKNILIEKIWTKTKVLFLFEAISWDWYYFDFENSKQDLTVLNNKIDIEFSYRGATNFLKKSLQYYTETYISDY